MSAVQLLGTCLKEVLHLAQGDDWQIQKMAEVLQKRVDLGEVGQRGDGEVLLITILMIFAHLQAVSLAG